VLKSGEKFPSATAFLNYGLSEHLFLMEKSISPLKYYLVFGTISRLIFGRRKPERLGSPL
jgi:hypothetical protein